MEGKLDSIKSTEFVGCVDDVLDSDTSSLTSEKDVLDNSREWTDEKHNLYLNQLEGSFVTQLQQSRSIIVGRCYELNKRNDNLSEKRQHYDTRDFSGQVVVLRNGRWQDIKSGCHIKSEFHPRSTNEAEIMNLSLIQKHKKRVLCHGLATCSRECFTSNLYQRNLFDLTQEGTGQNFSDDNNQIKSKMHPRAKRLKTPSINTPNLDQIVPQQPSDHKTNSSQ